MAVEADIVGGPSLRLEQLRAVLRWLAPALAQYGYWLEPGFKQASQVCYFTFAPIGQLSPSGYFGVEEAALESFDPAAVEKQLGSGAWPSALIAVEPHGYAVSASGKVFRWQPPR